MCLLSCALMVAIQAFISVLLLNNLYEYGRFHGRYSCTRRYNIGLVNCGRCPHLCRLFGGYFPLRHSMSVLLSLSFAPCLTVEILLSPT